MRFAGEAKEASMSDIDPSNSYGTPEGPETSAAAHVTEPPIDFTDSEHPQLSDNKKELGQSKD